MWRESLRDSDEELITGSVPDPVVDDLEPVEIEEEEGHSWPPRLPQDRLESVDAQPAVGQARERVIEGELLQLDFSRLLGGDIKLNPLPELSTVGRVLDHDCHIAQPDSSPIPRHDAILGTKRIVRFDRLRNCIQEALLIIKVNDREPMLGMRGKVFRLPSQQRFNLRADVYKPLGLSDALNICDRRDLLDKCLKSILNRRIALSGRHLVGGEDHDNIPRTVTGK